MHIPNDDEYLSKFLKGKGEMIELIRNFNWSATSLGHPSSWPQSLITTLSNMLNSRFPMLLWWGPDLIQFYNDAYRPSLFGTDFHPHVLGSKAKDSWLEVWTIIEPLVDQVINTGEPTWSEDQLISIFRNNKVEHVYWTFGYSCVYDELGNRAGVLVICNETTEKVLALEALKHAKSELEYSKKQVENDRDNLNNFLLEAPAGICILSGVDMVYEFVNPSYQQLFPGRVLLGKPLIEALPEVIGDDVLNILQQVFSTGKTYRAEALLIPLAYTDKGEIIDRYFNFIYQARKDFGSDEVNAISVFAFEVTELVSFRKEIERSKNTLKLAIEAATIGTWKVDYKTMEVILSEKTADIYGFSELHVHLSAMEDLIVAEHQERVVEARMLTFSSESDFKEEFCIVPIGATNSKWVKLQGKTYNDMFGEPMFMTGTVMDISEQKIDEIRKNDFISMVSHEMKTPLTSINLYVQLLKMKTEEDENGILSKSLKKITIQLKKMESLINGFLNISRLESGRIYLDNELFDLDLLIEEIIADNVVMAQGFEFNFRSKSNVSIRADRYKIGSVLTNLLGNAVKYSHDRKKILVDCSIKEPGFICVSITDQGMGISNKEFTKLFERYYRSESIKASTISGFGIGLYLSAEIVLLHGGKIWVDSEMGTGSVFNFTLPIE